MAMAGLARNTFAFEVDSTGDTKSMAPGESGDYIFYVRNYDDDGTAQVDLRVSIEIEYPSQLAGTGVIKAELFYEGTLISTDTGSGTLASSGKILPGGTPDKRCLYLEADVA